MVVALVGAAKAVVPGPAGGGHCSDAVEAVSAGDGGGDHGHAGFVVGLPGGPNGAEGAVGGVVGDLGYWVVAYVCWGEAFVVAVADGVLARASGAVRGACRCAGVGLSAPSSM